MFKFIILSLIIIIHDSPSFAQISHQKISNSIAENELAKAAMLAKNDIKAYKHLQEATNLDPSNSTFINSTAYICLLYTSPSPRDLSTSRMPSSA